jgi:F0F1-type ATP synthase assembly protein I
MDVAITLAVCVGLGWLLDRWLGTMPLFMIVLFLVAAVGLFAKLKYTYDAEMERLEARRSHSMADRDAA